MTIVSGLLTQSDKVATSHLKESEASDLMPHYLFTCLWYSCKLHTSNLPKSCLSPVSEGKEALAELPCERLAFGVL